MSNQFTFSSPSVFLVVLLLVPVFLTSFFLLGWCFGERTTSIPVQGRSAKISAQELCDMFNCSAQYGNQSNWEKTEHQHAPRSQNAAKSEGKAHWKVGITFEVKIWRDKSKAVNEVDKILGDNDRLKPHLHCLHIPSPWFLHETTSKNPPV